MSLPSTISTCTLLISSTTLGIGARYAVRIDLANAKRNEDNQPFEPTVINARFDAPAGLICKIVCNEPSPETIERHNIIRVLTLEIENIGDSTITFTDKKLILFGYGQAPRPAGARAARETITPAGPFTVKTKDGVTSLATAASLAVGGAGSGDMTRAVYDTDNSGVVDNAAALGGVAASGYVLKSTLAAKGDIYVATGSGVIVRLPVGTDGQTIVADSSQLAGIKWGVGGATLDNNMLNFIDHYR